MGLDGLGALGCHRKRRREEPDADLFLFSPYHLTGCFEAIELDDELEGVGDIECSIDTETRTGLRIVTYGAGKGGLSVAEGDDASFQHASARVAA